MIVTLVLLFFKALLFGFVVAAPVGPVGAMVIKRTLHHGRAMGFFTGAGSALGDTLYAVIVALGISAVQSFVLAHEQAISLVGGFILIIVGIFALKKNFAERRATSGVRSAESSLNRDIGEKLQKMDQKFEASFHRNSFFKRAFQATLASFLITISNPVTIVGFAGTFAAFGFWSESAPQNVQDLRYLTVVGGIMLGAMSWWILLASLIHWLGNRLSNTWIFRIHVSTSLVIIVSALLCLGRALSLSY